MKLSFAIVKKNSSSYINLKLNFLFYLTTRNVKKKIILQFIDGDDSPLGGGGGRSHRGAARAIGGSEQPPPSLSQLNARALDKGTYIIYTILRTYTHTYKYIRGACKQRRACMQRCRVCNQICAWLYPRRTAREREYPAHAIIYA